MKSALAIKRELAKVNKQLWKENSSFMSDPQELDILMAIQQSLDWVLDDNAMAPFKAYFPKNKKKVKK